MSRRQREAAANSPGWPRKVTGRLAVGQAPFGRTGGESVGGRKHLLPYNPFSPQGNNEEEKLGEFC